MLTQRAYPHLHAHHFILPTVINRREIHNMLCNAPTIKGVCQILSYCIIFFHPRTLALAGLPSNRYTAPQYPRPPCPLHAYAVTKL